jgi:hypothetical protein
LLALAVTVLDLGADAFVTYYVTNAGVAAEGV